MCFRLDSAVIVIVNILSNRLGEGFKGGIILLNSIEHFIFQSAKAGFHNAVVVTVALSGHGLNDSVLLKFTAVESCSKKLPDCRSLPTATFWGNRNQLFHKNLPDYPHLLLPLFREIYNQLFHKRRRAAFSPYSLQHCKKQK